METSYPKSACQERPVKPLSQQRKEKIQDLLYAELQVRLDISALKRALEKRERIKQELAEIEKKIEESKKKPEN